MLIKFFGGTGGGGGIATYLVDPNREGREGCPPEVLRGDIDQTRELIDSQDRKWTFTTGVIGFAPEDAPTQKEQEAVMDDFERLSFAGLERDQYDITWVRHSHTESGRVELHFLVPRMELSTGKALNIAPPGWERSFAPLRDAWNYEKGWARPDDPDRARSQQFVFERPDRGDAREVITSYLEDRIVAGQVEDRGGIVAGLKELGFEVPRAGKNYVTAHDVESGERFRLKGKIYEQGWTREAEFVRETESQIGAGPQSGGGRDPARAEQARGELEAVIDRRAQANQDKYLRPDHRDRDRGEGPQDQSQDRAERDKERTGAIDVEERPDRRGDRELDHNDPLGRDELSGDQREQRSRDLLREGQDDAGRRGPDQRPEERGDHDRRERDSSDAPRERDTDFPMRERQDPLHPAGGVEPHGQTDILRDRVIEGVRELGSRVRDIGQRLKEHGSRALEAVRAFFRPDEDHSRASERAGGEIERSDRSLEQAERVIRSFADKHEQVDGRAEQVERLKDLEERAQEIMQRQRERGERER